MTVPSFAALEKIRDFTRFWFYSTLSERSKRPVHGVRPLRRQYDGWKSD